MMTKEQRARFETLVAEEVNASMDLVRARNRAADSHRALTMFVDSLVPVGTPDALLDIPSFLRQTNDEKKTHGPGDAMVAGCFCDYCSNARMQQRLQGG